MSDSTNKVVGDKVRVALNNGWSASATILAVFPGVKCAYHVRTEILGEAEYGRRMAETRYRIQAEGEKWPRDVPASLLIG